jgi:hypothetical protein
MTTKKENTMGQLIRVVILSWSAALLTASYAGMFAKMDPTFIATVFTASAATFGINTMKKGGDDDDEKKEEPTREEFVVAPPPPPIQEPAWSEPSREMTWGEPSTTLEERVEALETKIEGEDGEGFVTPRTGDI